MISLIRKCSLFPLREKVSLTWKFMKSSEETNQDFLGIKVIKSQYLTLFIVLRCSECYYKLITRADMRIPASIFFSDLSDRNNSLVIQNVLEFEISKAPQPCLSSWIPPAKRWRGIAKGNDTRNRKELISRSNFFTSKIEAWSWVWSQFFDLS